MSRSFPAVAVLFAFALACDPAPVVDAGVDAGAADAGSDAGPALCRPSPLMPWPNRPCSEATRACVEACGRDNACGDGCIDADPTPNCRQCANVNIVACLNRNGCQPSWDCFRECGDDAAPFCRTQPDPEGCIVEQCAEEEQANFDCVETLLESTECAFRYEDCVPEAP